MQDCSQTSSGCAVGSTARPRPHNHACAGGMLVSPLVEEMLQRLDAEILRYERVIQYWPVFGPLLEGAVCAVLRETTSGVLHQCGIPQLGSAPQAATQAQQRPVGPLGGTLGPQPPSNPQNGCGAHAPRGVAVHHLPCTCLEIWLVCYSLLGSAVGHEMPWSGAVHCCVAGVLGRGTPADVARTLAGHGPAQKSDQLQALYVRSNCSSHPSNLV